MSAKYWRSFDTVRIQENQDGGIADVLLKDGEIRQVARSGRSERGQVQYAAARRPSVETLALCDVWSLMRIDFAGPNGGHYDFDHFLEFAQRPPQTSRVTEDGHECIRLDLTVVSDVGLVQHVTLWHDLNRNYLVWKMTVAFEKSSHRGKTEVLEFAEPVPGVFVPIKCCKEAYRESGLRSRQDITLADVEVNKPIPASVLQLPAVPAGTMLDDHLRGTLYPINENWEAIGPAGPRRQLSVPSRSENSPSDHSSQSTSEAISLSRLILPASLLILVVACACLIYRHYRARNGLRQVN